MRRNAIRAAAKAAARSPRPSRRGDPPAPYSAEPQIAAADAFAELKAGADMAAIMAASYWIGVFAFGVELPLGTARSWQLLSRR